MTVFIFDYFEEIGNANDMRLRTLSNTSLAGAHRRLKSGIAWIIVQADDC